MTERLVDREVRWLNLNTADITGGANPAYTGVVGVGVAGGYTNSIGTVNARNDVQTWFKVNMREVVGTKWANKYKTFGIRPVYVNWSAHRQFFGSQNARFLRISYSGLPWMGSYDVKTKGRRNEQVIVPSINEVMSANSQLVYCFGFGNAVFPASEFQLLADVDYYDITISYSCADGSSSITYAFNASQSYALPTAQYGFIIWPIVPKTALVQTHGYPLQKTKRLRLEGDTDPEEDDGILS